ncbi:EAL domain-containing protein [Rhizobium beringeri]
MHSVAISQPWRKNLDKRLHPARSGRHSNRLSMRAAGAIKGVEALARWNLQTGRVSPEIFIPIAEKSGLIDQLGMLILSTAIDEAQQWPAITLSVNVSPMQLRNPNFAAEVIALLHAKKRSSRLG